MPGTRIRVVQRFTPDRGADKSDKMSFVKLKGRHGGWVPVMTGNGVAGVVPYRAR